MEKSRTKEEKIRSLIGTLVYAAAASVAAMLFILFVAQRTIVDGSSMYPTLEDGDNLIVSRISYGLGSIKRFDIVVFPYNDPGRGKVCYIKRIIGMPGEIVEIVDGKIYISDSDGTHELKEDYGYYEGGMPMAGYDAAQPVDIGDDEYFVLGDNRNKSSDSRTIGNIKKSDIIGKAVFRMYPFDAIGIIR